MVISRTPVTLRNTPLAIVALCAALAAFLISDPAAHAALTHPYTGQSIGPKGLGEGSFSSPNGVAVDQTSGDVFVYDANEGGQVYKFDATGEPVDFSSSGTNVITGVGTAGPHETEVAVDSSAGPDAGDIYVANNRVVRVYGADGSLLGELTGGEMCGVAVDPSGAVYVGIYPETVRRYVPVTNPVTNGDETGALGGASSVCNVAADGEGNVYAAAYSGGVTRYDALQFGSNHATGTLVDARGATLTVDPSTNDLYVNEGSTVSGYDSSGVLVSSTGTGQLSASTGVGVKGGGDLYAPAGGRVAIFGATMVIPDVAIEAPSITATTATLKGTVNPDGLAASSCLFEYGREELTSTAPCVPTPGSGNAPVPVSANIENLASDTTYHYRLVARNVNGVSRSEEGSFTTLGPGIFEEAFSEVGTSGVTLAARVQANGQPTTVTVEYGLTSAYGSTSAPVGAGSGTGSVKTAAKLKGLQPATTYHVRMVASNESATAYGKDLTFTTFAPSALGLPDNRGYEKVSSSNADGNVYQDVPLEVSTEGGFTELPFVAAADGNAFAYVADPSESGGVGREGAGAGNEYLATRAPTGGWSAVNITPSSDRFQDVPVYQGFSKNLTAGFLSDKGKTGLAPGAPSGGYSVLYENNFNAGSYLPLVTKTPPNRGPGGFGGWGVLSYSPVFGSLEPTYSGGSADLKHVLYMANDALTPEAVDGGEEENNLYDYHEGALSSVNVLPNGNPEPNATFGGQALPQFREGDPPALTHVISEDGSRIFWTGLSTHDLYLREDGTRTVQVDASVGGGSLFWTASPDGSKVLFTKAGDLYEYDVASAQTTDLTPGGEVQGVVGTSDDLSYVYFVADAALAAGAEHHECVTLGNGTLCNLYALHIGEPVRLIGVLDGADNFSKPESFAERVHGPWQASLADKEAEVTPDGRHMLFGTIRSITGYESEGKEEIFLYDFDSAHLACVSCNPTGERPSHGHYSAYLPVSHVATHLPRWMSEDGNRAFFDTFDALVPTDTNGASDVYEWERDGTGSCTQSGGCIFLLSGGVGTEGSTLADASASGDDVFITTRSRLSPEDQNETIDVYDVRVGAPRPPAAPQCTGTGCQGIPSAPPVFSTPSSATYSGVGNFAALPKAVAKAKKPKARKKPKAKKKPKSKKKRKGKKASLRVGSINKSAESHGRGK
jgi:hypothetical protein